MRIYRKKASWMNDDHDSIMTSNFRLKVVLLTFIIGGATSFNFALRHLTIELNVFFGVYFAANAVTLKKRRKTVSCVLYSSVCFPRKFITDITIHTAPQQPTPRHSTPHLAQPGRSKVGTRHNYSARRPHQITPHHTAPHHTTPHHTTPCLPGQQ